MFLLAQSVKIGIVVGVIGFLALLAILLFLYFYDGHHRRHL